MSPNDPSTTNQTDQSSASAAAKPPKKSTKKSKVIALVIAIVAVLLACSAALGYFVWYQNPQKVVTDALVGVTKFEQGSFDGEFTVSSNDGSEDFRSMTISAEGEFKEDAFSARIDGSVESDEFDTVPFEGEVRNVDDEFYGKVSNATAMIDVLMGASNGSTQPNGKLFEVMAESLNDQWIELSTEEAGAASNECAVEAIETLRNDKEVRKEITTAYKENMFIVIEDKLGSKDGNLGYEISFDTDVARDFAKALNDTTVGKSYEECADEELLKPGEDDTDESDDNTKIELWVSRWTHQLRAVSIEVEGDDSTGSITLNMAPKNDVEVEVPEDAKSFTEVQADMEDALREYYLESMGGYTLPEDTTVEV